MKRLAIGILLIIVAQLLCGDALQDLIASARHHAIESRSAAERGLLQLERFEQLEMGQKYAFVKPEPQGTHFGLGAALPLLGVSLESLKNFDSVPEPEPQTVVIDTRHVLHVVLGGGEVVSVVEVVRRDPEGWTTASLGQQFVAERALDVINTLRLPIDQAVLIRLGGVRLTFVGFERDGVLTLAPINDEPYLGLKKGVSISALRLFRQLAPIARTIDRTMPN